MQTIDRIGGRNPQRDAARQYYEFAAIEEYGSSRVHDFFAIATPEDDGGFSIYAIHYPGIVSQCDDLTEAKANIADAFVTMLHSAADRGVSLKFSSDAWVEVSSNAVRLRVTVNG